MKKLLILGGTQFIGRNVIEKLVELNQYEITLFNRQKTNAELFPNCIKIKGDRETDDINQLSHHYWDFVIDFSSYYPISLDKFISTMHDKIGRYIYISTCSVYDLNEENQFTTITEDSFPILACTEEQKKDTTMQTYGERKAECERVLMKYKYLDKIILRPCIVYGKYDHTDRFYYWLYKIHQQNEFILPKCEYEKITLTYIADLVNIIIQSLEIQEHSIFYNTSTHEPFSLKNILLKMENTMKGVEIDVPTLLNKGIIPGIYAPLWFNISLKVSNEKLLRDFKMQCIPFEQSIAETKQYYESKNWYTPKTGFDSNLEKELLSKYKTNNNY